MSDPMTRTDIEDVLSSIRRLVSEEARPEPPLRAPGAAVRAPDPSANEPKLTGRLVLTPALRVADVPDAANDGRDATAPLSPEAPAPADPEPPAAPDVAPPVAPDAAPDALPEDRAPGSGGQLSEQVGAAAIEATIAELETAVAARVEQWDPDGTEAAVEDENHLDAFVGPVRFVHRGASHTTPPDESAPAARVAPTRLHAESRRRAPEKPTAEATVDTAPDAAAGTKATPAAPISASDALAQTLAQCAEAADALSDPEDAKAPAFHSGRGMGPDAGAEGAEDARPAPETGSAAIDWEDSLPDEAHDAAVDSASQSAFADLDPRIDTAPEAEPGAEAETDPEGALLDEEALRDIVREMIRQELQGPLGERITRSVRKLVRSEINRAFASRDLE